MHIQLQTIYPRIRIVATSHHFSNHTLASALFPVKLRIPEVCDTNLTANGRGFCFRHCEALLADTLTQKNSKGTPNPD